MGGFDGDRGPDHGLAAIARGQHGVVTRRQALELGLGSGAISHRLLVGRLRQVHRGVYAVGGTTLTSRGLELAAVLACGPHAVLSHRSAASFWRLLPYLPDSTDVSVTVTAGHARSQSGIDVHRCALERRDYVVRESIPVTAPARTILDLAGGVALDELERAIAEGRVLRIVSERGLREQLARNPGRAGTRRLRRLLDLDGGPAPTRSEAERRMLALVRAARLPLPEVNVRVGAHEVDFLWRRERLVVEVDGRRFHSSPRSFERDRARDADLAAAGLTVVRVTWRQLTEEPEAVAARLGAALAVRG